ncbi:MAG: hypothetical protein KF837_43440 [Labilithrix sp.]|nr:hypothetical protein [Labilithrix sp.]
MANLTNTDEPEWMESSDAAPIEAHRPDRISPAMAGAVAGAVAGGLALALVHAIASGGLAAAMERAAAVRGVSFEATLGLAYATAAAAGTLTGGLFGNVTRNLRKWPALAIWSVVYFTSAAIVFVLATRATLAGPIVAAGALYGLLVSVSLPIRRAR